MGFTKSFQDSIKTFTPTELELLLNGKEEIDLDEVKSSTRYTGVYTGG